MYQQPPKQKQPLSKSTKIATAVILSLALGSCALCGIINSTHGAGSNTQAETPINTDTPQPQSQATPKATPKPKPRSTLDAMKQLANSAETFNHDTETGWVDDKHTHLLINDNMDSYTTATDVKLDAYAILSTMYQSKELPRDIKTITIIAMGPITDAYGNTSIGALGQADLTRSDEANFNWPALDENGAWDVYTSTWLLPGI
jgi:hypothetical protein